jgi:hypothetical protein
MVVQQPLRWFYLSFLFRKPLTVKIAVDSRKYEWWISTSVLAVSLLCINFQRQEQVTRGYEGISKCTRIKFVIFHTSLNLMFINCRQIYVCCRLKFIILKIWSHCTHPYPSSAWCQIFTAYFDIKKHCIPPIERVRKFHTILRMNLGKQTVHPDWGF